MPTAPVCLPGASHEQRSLVGYSPQGHKESNRTEHTRPINKEAIFNVNIHTGKTGEERAKGEGIMAHFTFLCDKLLGNRCFMTDR